MSEKLKTIIIDDEASVRSLTRKLIEKNCPQLEVVNEADGVASGLKLIESSKPDLVFLDVEMKDGSGFDLLKKLGTYTFKVVFITAHDDYAVDAFRHSAIDYILKPLYSDSLVEAVDKVLKQHNNENYQLKIDALLHNSTQAKVSKKLILKTSDNIFMVDTSDIVYCQSEGNYTTFFLSDKRKIVVSKLIKEFEEVLDNKKFFRTHQSYLLNFDFFREYKKNEDVLILKDNTQIPLASRKKEDFMEFLKMLS